MEIKYGEGKTEYGPGVEINLTGDEVATAIAAYIVAHGVHYQGPRTITVNGNLCVAGRIYVDPSGFVIDGEGMKYSGRGGPSEFAPTPEETEAAKKFFGITEVRCDVDMATHIHEGITNGMLIKSDDYVTIVAGSGCGIMSNGILYGAGGAGSGGACGGGGGWTPTETIMLKMASGIGGSPNEAPSQPDIRKELKKYHP